MGGATSLHPASLDIASGSVTSPLAPEYVIAPDGSVTLRICFNWSCASRQTVTFTADDIALVKKRMAICSGSNIYERLQRVRIGIWQMERLAEKYQPLLANDLSINDFEEDVEGRTDCIDNSSNTTTYLHILRDTGELPGWMISKPKMRLPWIITEVHWTAVITDTESRLPWSIDSWYRPNGHLPMVIPLQNWINEENAWEPPFEHINQIPHSAYELCDTQRPNPL
ncbi:hypothetical protein BOW51_11335 [Solemya velesiana gill symbiont]|uniref:Uncharacterized protein n=2 Tax=Solemya velesiana gill symbiont TaxID=1918948 RepID=A0A1T2KRT2_9GAMM|nr:hypothetical protein BOW51_11335 [Solemya velesiana gill symbiont]